MPLKERIKGTDEGRSAGLGAKCFEPGLGFRFKAGEKSFELVICLRCSWIYVYKGGEDLATTWALSKEGVERLKKFYLSQVGEPGKK